MQIRPMVSTDDDAVVAVHLAAFPGFFLSFLGPKFLSALYRGIAADPSGIALVAVIQGQTVGFAAGTTQPSGLYGRLLKRQAVQFAWASLPTFLKSPRILPRLLRAFTMPGQALPAPNCGTLMSIAVDPSCQGRGVGKYLLEAFLKESSRRGTDFVNLTTDAAGNDAANRFYRSLGFELFQTYTTPEGREMNEYLFRLRRDGRGQE